MSTGPGEERVTKEVQANGHKEVRTTVNNRNRKVVGQDSGCVCGCTSRREDSGLFNQII